MLNKKNKFNLKIFSLLLTGIIFIFGIFYVVFRWMYTLNLLTSPFTSFWSYTLLFAELLTFVVFTNFSIILFALDKVKKIVIDNKLQKDYAKDVYKNGELVSFKNFCPSVAIFICTYNEEADLLAMTISGCKNIDYPNKTVYVLDDGKRDEIKKLTELLGCKYITRKTNKGYKAGNINNALSITESDLIVIFDADHIPASTFLRETVYNFVNENLALVQTPQFFCNLDAFQKNLELPLYLANEQDIFYKVVEPGLNVYGSVFCGGTNIVLNREHLASVGNFPETTITEDSLLGLIFHANKYDILYYNRPIAVGLAASSFEEYIKQRVRWCKGNLQIMTNPYNWQYYAKLTPIQTFFYLSGFLYFITPLARLVFLMAPVLFLFFDISPLLVLFYQIFAFQLSYFFLKFLFILSRKVNVGNIVFADVYDLLLSIFTIGGILNTLFVPKFMQNFTFSVTNKSGNIKSESKYIVIVSVILAVLALAEIQGLYDLLFVDLYSELAVIANLVWNTINISVLMYALRVVSDKPEKRYYQRIRVDDEIEITDCENKKHDVDLYDASRSGISFISNEILDVGECDVTAKMDDFQAKTKFVASLKLNNATLYKMIFKRPLFLLKLTRRMVRRLDSYIRFAYKRPDSWQDTKLKKKNDNNNKK